MAAGLFHTGAVWLRAPPGRWAREATSPTHGLFFPTATPRRSPVDGASVQQGGRWTPNLNPSCPGFCVLR